MTITSKQEQVLAYLARGYTRQDGGVWRLTQEVSAALDVTISTAYSRCAALRDKGLVVRHEEPKPYPGNGYLVSWSISEDGARLYFDNPKRGKA